MGGRFAMRFGFVWVRVGACGEESLPILYGWRELLVRQFFFECTLWNWVHFLTIGKAIVKRFEMDYLTEIHILLSLACNCLQSFVKFRQKGV